MCSRRSSGCLRESRRRYGGYMVHVGIVLAFLGFAGGGYEREEAGLLSPGQQVEVAPYMNSVASRSA